MIPEEKCCRCRFYSMPLCRRRAPGFAVETNRHDDVLTNHGKQTMFFTSSKTKWPEVKPDDWCGEFEWPNQQNR